MLQFKAKFLHGLLGDLNIFRAYKHRLIAVRINVQMTECDFKGSEDFPIKGIGQVDCPPFG